MNRPSFTLSRAAQVTGVSRSTIRRYHEAGDFPNAWKTTKGVWMVPVEDLLAKGLKVGEAKTKTTLSEPAQDEPRAIAVGMPTGVPEEVVNLRVELATERARRESAEALLIEVRRRADSLDMALKQIEAAKPAPAPTPPPAAPAPPTARDLWKQGRTLKEIAAELGITEKEAWMATRERPVPAPAPVAPAKPEPKSWWDKLWSCE